LILRYASQDQQAQFAIVKKRVRFGILSYDRAEIKYRNSEIILKEFMIAVYQYSMKVAKRLVG
jgi:hypothetical protein